MAENNFATFVRGAAATALLGGALTLAGCGSSDGGSDGDSTGTLSLGVTDAPVDSAQEVVVQFDAVEIKPADGDSRTISFDEAKSIDLLKQQGENSASLIDGEEVVAGDYNWIRLHITANESQTDSYIALDDGSEHSLFIPSGDQSGLKLVSGFTVPENADADFTVDFDLRKSITDPGGGDYKLRPALRLVDNTEVGHIAADVTINATCDTPAIYVFEGGGETPHDVDTSAEEDTGPVTTAKLTVEEGGNNYTGTAGFLTAGTYTVALTCEAGQDVSDEPNDISFVGVVDDVEVQADQTATYSHTVN